MFTSTAVNSSSQPNCYRKLWCYRCEVSQFCQRQQRYNNIESGSPIWTHGDLVWVTRCAVCSFFRSLNFCITIVYIIAPLVALGLWSGYITAYCCFDEGSLENIAEYAELPDNKEYICFQRFFERRGRSVATIWRTSINYYNDVRTVSGREEATIWRTGTCTCVRTVYSCYYIHVQVRALSFYFVYRLYR